MYLDLLKMYKSYKYNQRNIKIFYDKKKQHLHITNIRFYQHWSYAIGYPHYLKHLKTV